MLVRRMGPWMAGVMVLLAIILVGQAVRVARPPKPSQVRYATGMVQEGPIQVLATGTGTVVWSERQAVEATVDGQVTAVAVKVGDQVKKEQVLFTLTNDDVTAAAEQARLQLEQARQRLRASGVTARTSTSTGAVEVVIPEAGRVVDLRVKVGDQVQQGALLATLVDSGSMEFTTQVIGPERGRLRPGQAATVRIDDFDQEISGVIRSVGSGLIAGNAGMFFEVRIGLKNPGLLRAGMSGQATMEADGSQVVRPGSVTWAVRRPLTAVIAGRVDQLDVAEGQEIQAGVPMARIANEAWPAEVEQLRLGVSQAELTLRSKEEAQRQLVIKSTADGTVVAVNVKVGDRLTGGRAPGGSGSTSVEPVAIARSDAALITVAIDEMDVATVKAGQDADVTLPALPGKKFGGRVEQVALEGKSQNGVTTYDVQVRIDRPEGIRAGMTATASIQVAARPKALLVPVEAVQDTPQGPVVRVLDGERPRPVPVRVGLRNDQVAEVLSSLRTGDRVVLAEFDPAASAAQGPGGFPGGGLMGRPGGRGTGGFGGPGGGGRPGGGGGSR